MKRAVLRILLLLLLVSGLWTGATYWVGLKTEQSYKALLKEASQVQYLKFQNESYSRNLFGAVARSVVEVKPLSDEAGQNEPVRLTLVHDIKHGPLPIGKSPEGKLQFKPMLATMETRIELSPEAKSRLKELYEQVPEIESMRSYTTIGLNGAGEETFIIPAFSRSFGNEEKAAVDWKGLSLKLDFSPDFKKLSGSLNVPGLEVKAKDLEIRINGIKSAFSFHEGASGLSLGDTSFDLSGLEFLSHAEAELKAVSIQGLSANGSNTEAGDNINCSFAVRADQLRLDSTPYGPGAIKLEIRNIDSASLAKLQKTIGELQAHAAQKSQQEMQRDMLSSYTEILPALVKKSPEIELTQCDVKTGLGDFSARAKISLDADKAGPLIDPVTIAKALTFHADLKAARDLLRQVVLTSIKNRIVSERKERKEAVLSDQEIASIASEQMEEQLKALRDQKFLVEENGNYVVSANYTTGEVVINGRPIPLQGFIH